MEPTSNWQESVAPPMDEARRMELAKAITATRKMRGMTQEQLAKASGVPSRTIGYMEQKASVPQASTINKLMVALDMHPKAKPALEPHMDLLVNMTKDAFDKIPENRRAEVLSKVVVFISDEMRAILQEQEK